MAEQERLPESPDSRSVIFWSLIICRILATCQSQNYELAKISGTNLSFTDDLVQLA
jgi:hypothetical protein